MALRYMVRVLFSCLWFASTFALPQSPIAQGEKAKQSCDATIQEYLRQTPRLDIEHRAVLERSGQARLEKPYMQVLRNFGFRQATAEIEVLWDGGIVNVQTVNIQFSDSYDLVRTRETTLKGLFPPQATVIQRYFRIVLSEQAKLDLPTLIKRSLDHYRISEPAVIATADYTLFDTPCIPNRAYEPDIEGIKTVESILTMRRLYPSAKLEVVPNQQIK